MGAREAKAGGVMGDDANGALLCMMLSAAVPMWAHKLKTVPMSELIARGPMLADVIGSKGDIIQFRSKKKGETAEAFNRLAEALAIMSFFPGGVKFCGDHYEHNHPGTAEFMGEAYKPWW